MLQKNELELQNEACELINYILEKLKIVNYGHYESLLGNISFVLHNPLEVNKSDYYAGYLHSGKKYDCSIQQTIHNIVQVLTDKTLFYQISIPMQLFLEFFLKICSQENSTSLMKSLIEYRDENGRDVLMRLLIMYHYYNYPKVEFNVVSILSEIIKKWVNINSQALILHDNNENYLCDYIFSYSNELYENVFEYNKNILKIGNPISTILNSYLNTTITVTDIQKVIANLGSPEQVGYVLYPRIYRMLNNKKTDITLLKLKLFISECESYNSGKNKEYITRQLKSLFTLMPSFSQSDIDIVLSAVKIERVTDVELCLLSTFIKMCSKSQCQYIINEIFKYPDILAKNFFHIFTIGLKANGSIQENFTEIISHIISKLHFPNYKELMKKNILYITDQDDIDIYKTKLEDYVISNKLTFVKLLNRTVIFKNPLEQYVAIKLKKEKENSRELVKQFTTVKKLNEIKKESGRLCSNIPIPIGLVQFSDLTNWVINNLSSESEGILQKAIGNGDTCLAYIYQAHPDYFTYITEIIDDEKFFQSLQNTYSDLCYLLSEEGLAFPQLIQLFHARFDHNYDVRYKTINKFYSSSSSPQGRIFDKKEAVAYPNIRQSGLADEGDNISILKLLSNHFDSKYLMQRELYNLIAEYMFVAQLIVERRTKYINSYLHDDNVKHANWSNASYYIMSIISNIVAHFTEHNTTDIYNHLISIINLQQYAEQLKTFSSKKAINELSQNPQQYSSLYPNVEVSSNSMDMKEERMPDPVTLGYISRMSGLLYFANHSKKHASKSKSVDTVISNNLMASLKEYFPIYEVDKFKLYAFSNENYYYNALSQLNNTPSIEASKTKIALLFGESRLLSILPEFAKHVNIIITADIEYNLHAHTKHLLRCLKNASSIKEFIELYKTNNPVQDVSSWNIDVLLEGLNGEQANDSLREYHFLSSDYRFQQCKDALSKLAFVNINLNLLDKSECEKLSVILDKHSACLSICNFTNIHQYDSSPMHEYIKSTTEILLQNSPDCFFMYSTGPSYNLNTNFSVCKNNYFNLTETYSNPTNNISMGY
jgi:hypothetical protein